jgi:hypothetical protein
MKIIVTVVFMVISLFALGQIEKGSKIVGVNFAGLGATRLSDPVFYLNVNPFIAQFCSNRFALGAGANAGLVAGGGNGLTFSLGVSPIARWYNNSIKNERFLTPDNKGLLLKYAGLTMQILASLAVAVFLGFKADEWLNFKTPLFVWILPLLVIIAMIYQVIKDTSKKQ